MVYNEHASETIHTNELKLIISVPLLKYLIYSSFFYLPHFHRPLGPSQQTENPGFITYNFDNRIHNFRV